jgi:hypothetical protein
VNEVMTRAMGKWLGMVAPLRARRGVDFIESHSEADADAGTPSELYEADIITSQMGDTNWHKILLDIDSPCYLVESSTPGHFHLYIDMAIEWESYKKVLLTLAKEGIIEAGYAQASFRRGFTSLRPPWRAKGDQPIPPNPGGPEANPIDPPPF